MIIKHNIKYILFFIFFMFNSTLFANTKNVIIAIGSDITTLEPYDANDTLSQNVSKSFYQGLFEFDKNMHIKNVLAKSYKIEKSGYIWIIYLKSGIKFHDNTNFNANSVKINFDRFKDKNNNFKRYSLFSIINQVIVVNDLTVKFILKQPISSFINILAHPASVIVSPSAINKYGKNIKFHPVGTGPYIFIEWSEKEYLKVKKWKNFWKKNYPKLDSITWLSILDNNSRVIMLKNGEVDFAFPISYEQIKFLKNKSYNIKISVITSIMQRYISFNITKPPFNNLKVRKAINYAINRHILIKVAFSGYAIPSYGIISPLIKYSISYPTIKYNIKKSKELLKQAGYPNGFNTILWSSHNNNTSLKALQIIQQQLLLVGIHIKIFALNTEQRVTQVESKNKNNSELLMLYTGWSPSTGEINWALSPLFSTSSFPPELFNTSFYSNKIVDTTLINANKTNNIKIKKELYKKIQDIIWNDKPWAPLVIEKLICAYNKNLINFFIQPDGGFDFNEADKVY
ncbi:glutathione ABC transporter substrate-binding protein GsiB [Enterobacteriaceae endosymbiont of Plateumaris consimilis]|uniref:glutathione ABC transporter substrate-binding protein GsiB n=1 Tax=Enterobacteriaceae endosymbiont of Plateumaris consimilis TaxID=2675794 RepID=UPI001448FE67|nr:glutathione ABC transporter substrate-binding protein GsiB [Enterobacteriaceae endosymbiont of Plateumaris consimilis]QJC28442.1 glutathione ABC transporter substrate-binding protein GsiB [Enterobacteriaceae endosymbiont of Plateumaris consimilis]